MSVLVKGMTMPSNCDSCEFMDCEDVSFELLKYCRMIGMYIDDPLVRPYDCPLVELPEHHGRLIDADEMKNLWAGCSINGSISPLLDARPTVVEAE